MAKRTCSSCGNGFIGRGGAEYCSAACRQRARRARGGGDRNAKCDTAVTDTATAPPAKAKRGASRRAASTTSTGGVHCVEAVALLQALDAELAVKSDAMGLPPEQPLEWTAVELALLETVAGSIDRKVDLYARYRASDDDKVRVKLSGEVRLLERLAADLLKRVSTDLPAAPSHVSVKASEAAKTRWARNAAR
jgi:hypothetical protein